MKVCFARLIARSSLGALSSLLVVFPIVSSIGHSQSQHKGDRKLVVKQLKELPARAKRFAIVIGVDDYQDTQINSLEGATNDAKMLADALIRFAGFPQDQVILIASDQPTQRQPNRGNILQYLSNLRGLVPEDGLLLVSFAGHGIERGGRGYLCPNDARTSGSLTLLEATAIPVDTLREMIRETSVRQVLITLDACRNNPSGRGEGENAMSQSYARQFNFDVRNKEVTAFATLYATDVGNVAYEYKEKKQGYFTWALVEGIKGAAANERGEVTLAGLRNYLQEVVPKRVRLDLGQEKKQKPFAVIEGYKAEELVISITERGAAKNLAPPKADPSTLELAFWNSIKDSVEPDDFSEYLAQYPQGAFAGLARNRMKNLERSAESLPEPGPTRPTPSSEQPEPSKGISSFFKKVFGGRLLRDYEFDSVTLNSNGTEKERRKAKAKYYWENVNRIDLEMVAIPPGRFLMGSTDQDTEKPVREVAIGSFYMGKVEVTQAQWRTAASFPKVTRELMSLPSHFRGDDLPVEQVSWEDALEFCARLSRASGRTYRLPTEAEWEYACRAGTTTSFTFGETITPDTVNYCGNYPYAKAPRGIYRERTVAVGSLGVANAFGLFDMHGNVAEWCMDGWHENYKGAPLDGNYWGVGEGQNRVVRGGSWLSDAAVCRSAYRGRSSQENRHIGLGFRVVADI